MCEKQGNLERFRQTWEESVADAVAARSLKLVAVSFPDLGVDTGLAIAAMNAVMEMGPSVNRDGKAKFADDGNLVGPENGGKRVQVVNGDSKMEGFVGGGVAGNGTMVRAEGSGGLGEDMGRAGKGGGEASGVAPALNIWQVRGQFMLLRGVRRMLVLSRPHALLVDVWWGVYNMHPDPAIFQTGKLLRDFERVL